MPLVLDEAQGFYTGENRHSSGRVIRTMEFSREIAERILRFAVDRAGEVWPGEEPARVLMAYKFHLLDGAFDDWVAAFRYHHGIDARLFQPDIVNRNMITHGLVDRTVIVAGNEWAAIMHVVLLDRFGSERQENRCTENVYLHPDLNSLVEYQTVHGSADDLEGTDTVNPTATVRAAALIAERHVGCAGAVAAVETALAAVLDGLEPDAVRSNPVYTAARVRIGVDLLALFDAGPRPDTPADLTGRGWTTTVHTPFDFTRRHGRGPLPEPDDALAANRWGVSHKRGPAPGRTTPPEGRATTCQQGAVQGR